MSSLVRAVQHAFEKIASNSPLSCNSQSLIVESPHFPLSVTSICQSCRSSASSSTIASRAVNSDAMSPAGTSVVTGHAEPRASQLAPEFLRFRDLRQGAHEFKHLLGKSLCSCLEIFCLLVHSMGGCTEHSAGSIEVLLRN